MYAKPQDSPPTPPPAPKDLKFIHRFFVSGIKRCVQKHTFSRCVPKMDPKMCSKFWIWCLRVNFVVLMLPRPRWKLNRSLRNMHWQVVVHGCAVSTVSRAAQRAQRSTQSGNSGATESNVSHSRSLVRFKVSLFQLGSGSVDLPGHSQPCWLKDVKFQVSCGES